MYAGSELWLRFVDGVVRSVLDQQGAQEPQLGVALGGERRASAALLSHTAERSTLSGSIARGSSLRIALSGDVR